MCKRVYLKAKEAEMEMQEARNAEGFTGKTEKLLIANMIKAAKNNSRIGDKLLMVVDPKQIHIPEWQRRIKLARAYSIGKENGYVQNDSASSIDTTISDRVEDIYFTLYDENDQELDVISYCMFYNQIGNREDEDIEIISEGWETLEKVA